MFNSIIVQHFSDPSHQGELVDAVASLKLGNPVCGDKIDIGLGIGSNRVIEKAKFRAWGCATSVAMANIFCDFIEGKDLEEVNSMDEQNIGQLLGELEPSQRHCLDMLRELFQQLKRVEA